MLEFSTEERYLAGEQLVLTHSPETQPRENLIRRLAQAHPSWGEGLTVQLQCELNRAVALLREMQDGIEEWSGSADIMERVNDFLSHYSKENEHGGK